MGCLFSCLDKNKGLELSDRLLKDGKRYESIDDDTVEADMDEFSNQNAKQIIVVNSAGVPSKKVSVEDFAFLKVATLMTKTLNQNRSWAKVHLVRSSWLNKKRQVNNESSWNLKIFRINICYEDLEKRRHKKEKSKAPYQSRKRYT